jgi:hypothetical protein
MTGSPDPDLLALALRHEQKVESAWRAAGELEAERGTGVRWAGLSSSTTSARSDAAIRTAALRQAQDMQTWRNSPAGQFADLVADAQRAATEAYGAGDAARAALSRGGGGEIAALQSAARTMQLAARALIRSATLMKRKAAAASAPRDPAQVAQDA